MCEASYCYVKAIVLHTFSTKMDDPPPLSWVYDGPDTLVVARLLLVRLLVPESKSVALIDTNPGIGGCPRLCNQGLPPQPELTCRPSRDVVTRATMNEEQLFAHHIITPSFINTAFD